MQVVTTTGTGPVSMAMARDHLRIYHTDDDTNIASALNAAVDTWNRDTLRPVIETTYQQEFSEVPAGWAFTAGPVYSVEHVKWYNADTKVATTLTSDQYRVQQSGAWNKLQFLYDFASDASAAGWWEVEWKAKWDVVPDDVIRAILMLAASYYDERDELTPLQMRSISIGWSRIASSYRWAAT